MEAPFDNNIFEPEEDFGEEISRDAIKSWAGSHYMTPVFYQFNSLSCLPHAVCDAVSAKYAIRMQKFIRIRTTNGTRPTRGGGPRSGGQRSGSSSIVAALPHLDEPRAVALSFSAQNLYDCVPRSKLTMRFGTCLDYVMQEGIHTLENYPLTDFRYQCECKSDSIHARKITVDRWEPCNADELVGKLDIEPIIASTHYRSIRERNFFYCGADRVVGLGDVSGFSVGGHALLVIGYGRDADGLYLIVKNSWSRRWGCRGYIKFRVDIFSEFWSLGAVRWMEL